MRKFQFVDFQPTSVLAEKAKEKLSRVFGESPSDSFVTAIIRKTTEGFVGQLKVRSAVGTFIADVISEDPLEAIENLSSDVRTLLREWKLSRVF